MYMDHSLTDHLARIQRCFLITSTNVGTPEQEALIYDTGHFLMHCIYALYVLATLWIHCFYFTLWFISNFMTMIHKSSALSCLGFQFFFSLLHSLFSGFFAWRYMLFCLKNVYRIFCPSGKKNIVHCV